MAIDAITAEIAHHPTATLYKERGRLLRMIGREAEAMSDLREAIRLDPTIVGSLQNGSFKGNIGSCH